MTYNGEEVTDGINAGVEARKLRGLEIAAIARIDKEDFQKMFHYFQFKKEEFLAHYHKRSNVETTVMMVKTKFGDAVRSKTEVAARNEVLCKILCHNICCLISAMCELGIEPKLVAC